MNAQSKIEPVSLPALLAQVLPTLGAVYKNKKNPAFKSSYADLSAVLEAIAPIAEHGLWFRQVPVQIDGGIGIETFYVHESGAELSAGITPVPVNKNDAQGLGSAMTYGRRYGLMTAFGLSSEDDDGNAAARGRSQRGAVSPSQPMPDHEWAKLVQLVQASQANIPALLKYLKIGLPNDDLRLLDQDQYVRVVEALNDKLSKLAKAETDAKAKEAANVG